MKSIFQTPDKNIAIKAIRNAIDNFVRGYDLNNNHSNLFNLCQAYKDTLDKFAQSQEIIYGVSGEVYMREHVLPDNTVMHFAWSIQLIDQLIIKNNLQPKKMKIGPLVDWIDRNGLEQERLQHALKNDRPVYVIDYAPSNLEILVDGNHRVASRIMMYENENMLISSHLIPAKIHVKALISSFQRAAFKILSNVGRMVVYLDKLPHENKVKKPDLFYINIE
ncbi:MAG: hypothetical protein WDZ91_01350 [Paenibacillaceae bacterium]